MKNLFIIGFILGALLIFNIERNTIEIDKMYEVPAIVLAQM